MYTLLCVTLSYTTIRYFTVHVCYSTLLCTVLRHPTNLKKIQSVCFFNSTSTLSYSCKLFHRVASLTIAPHYGFSGFFLTWIFCILTNTFVLTSTDSYSSNGNTKFVKGDIFKTQTTTIIKLSRNVASNFTVSLPRVNTCLLCWTIFLCKIFIHNKVE